VGLERRSVRVRGVVQGVGFRPAMYRLADSLGVTGFVRNDCEGVWLEIEGASSTLDAFVGALRTAAPPASRIDAIEVAPLRTHHDRSFAIADSPPRAADELARAEIPVDLGPCDECLRELDDPTDRRYRYPFINCTLCGPRFTIVRELPYDRPKTTMAAFAMCSACRREYETPSHRRFHAEPNACAACGPSVRLVVGGRVTHTHDEALRAAAAALADGQIVAIKGVGGFVLAVDATSERAVVRLRERKRRPLKAFAVMARSLAEAERIAVLDDAARALLGSPMRPIVLAPARPASLAPSVAPGLTDIGVYLPVTPLQYLLLADGPPLQVMTSGNLADEPIARTNAEAFARLSDVADLFLVHDREVHTRADDSVVRTSQRHAIPMRRARGLVPRSLPLRDAVRPVLAVGGHERNTVCLAFSGRATVSQHVGDLDHPDADAFFREAIAHLQELTGVAPEVVVHDLHPDYQSTRWAARCGLPRIAVQHHHAHVAACLAEHERPERVIGVAFDGTGLGDDGALWGGEILAADLGSATRLGHLRPIALAGGEAAIREPWRLAAAAVVDAGERLDVVRVPAASRDRVVALLATALPVRATSAGRWFDAVAALLGVGADISYDGQAACRLEALAGTHDAPPLELVVTDGAPFEIDLRPAIRELVHELRRDASPALLAARFHATMAHAVLLAARRTDARTVALTGGCFQNRRLLEQATSRLETAGIEVLVHHRVPPNDGGLSLGQAAIASHRLAKEQAPCA
jgi:hydrogenase maturation protein HypF